MPVTRVQSGVRLAVTGRLDRGHTLARTFKQGCERCDDRVVGRQFLIQVSRQIGLIERERQPVAEINDLGLAPVDQLVTPVFEYAEPTPVGVTQLWLVVRAGAVSRHRTIDGSLESVEVRRERIDWLTERVD